MINDLRVANTNIWMYVDDTTLAECVEKNGTSSMQSHVDEFVTESRAYGFQFCELCYFKFILHGWIVKLPRLVPVPVAISQLRARTD
ncbi:unnamed protein product [Pocillopora meandrina]|uniref:Uncharacterized protein n=1 Tax=Pocillopora meandrina TaxID=46732 RepID=A0AAU9XMZ8_9CNID|nr:unnamed protein product [Pocillopora meandrina]